MEKEMWKDIIGYEGLYKISNLGNIKSVKWGKERVLKHRKNMHGYLQIILCNKGLVKTRTIHQLVAIAFLNHKPNGRIIVVNHKNFIRTDNRSENLEIVTFRENTNQKHLRSSSEYTGVSWYKPLNKWRSAIAFNGKDHHIGYFKNEYDAHIAYENKLKEITLNQ